MLDVTTAGCSAFEIGVAVVVVALFAIIGGWADDDDDDDCRGALQALHAFVPKEFFNVHFEHDQNSPLRNVKSS